MRMKKLATILFAFTMFTASVSTAFADGRYQCHGCTCNLYKYFVDIDLVNSSGTTEITTMGPFEDYADAQAAADEYLYMYPEYSANIYDAQYCW
ncbi:hypothetical protein ACFQ88_28840 [Paenibacillus sp. NPDC056579]|uniref:hypothetical protein n=1 Tax=unclassified Paenibacillus TaxID=185978 RepID=UPI001EF81D8C|nr:hypothetical protein [Paenibacillus sp. H1-7]ULL19207.1 hypothetical protein DVH26_35190 [Paenibacillus sp. H1-7]